MPSWISCTTAEIIKSSTTHSTKLKLGSSDASQSGVTTTGLVLSPVKVIDPLVLQEVSYFDRLPSNLMTIIRLHLLLLYLH